MPWEDGSLGEIIDAWKDRLQQSFEKSLFPGRNYETEAGATRC